MPFTFGQRERVNLHRQAPNRDIRWQRYYASHSFSFRFLPFCPTKRCIKASFATAISLYWFSIWNKEESINIFPKRCKQSVSLLQPIYHPLRSTPSAHRHLLALRDDNNKITISHPSKVVFLRGSFYFVYYVHKLMFMLEIETTC